MKKGYKIGYFGWVTHFPNCMLVSNWNDSDEPELIRVSFTKENLQSIERHWSDIGVWKIKKLGGLEYVYNYFSFDKNIPKIIASDKNWEK